MGLKILIADSDEDWSAELKTFLTEQDYEVKTVINGRDAQIAIGREDYFAYVINMQITNHSAQQVLRFIKSNQKTGKVILVVNDKDFFEGDEAPDQDQLEKLGVTEMVFKPMTVMQFLETLEGHQNLAEMMSQIKKKHGTSQEEEVARPDDDFTKIRIEHFFSSKTVLFDVYVRFNSGKYVKILHAGDQFSKERIEKYKNEKGVEFLYFSTADRKKYLLLQNQMTKRAVSNNAVGSNVKVALLRDSVEKYIEELHEGGMKPQALDQGKEICENVHTLIENDESLWKLLRDYQDFDPSSYNHAFLVTMFASSIVKQFEWQSKVTIETVSMASMFHDIGKLGINPEIAKKNTDEMTPEELEEYKKHPEIGAEMLDGNALVPKSVKLIVAQHHELGDGTGYPHGLKDSKLFTLSKIVILANHFAHLLVDEELKPTEALKKILMDKNSSKRFNGFVLESFCKIFMDPGKIKKEHTMQSNSRMVKKAS